MSKKLFLTATGSSELQAAQEGASELSWSGCNSNAHETLGSCISCSGVLMLLVWKTALLVASACYCLVVGLLGCWGLLLLTLLLLQEAGWPLTMPTPSRPQTTRMLREP
jgi:hypothetical protein